MSTSPMVTPLKDAELSASGSPPTQVYNLVVLVQRQAASTRARAANLAIAAVEAPTVRAALNALVQQARQLISAQQSAGSEVPWITPPDEATDGESRFLVPMHL